MLELGPFAANAPFDQVIGGPGTSHTLLDIGISGVALAGDGTVYAASVTNAINVYAPGAKGDIAPEYRISGVKTSLSRPLGLAVYPP